MQKLLIVDGSNLLFQMFYGMPARIVNRQGKPIQGTLGFVGALLKTVRRFSPSHVVVLFDGSVITREKIWIANIRQTALIFRKCRKKKLLFHRCPILIKRWIF